VLISVLKIARREWADVKVPIALLLGRVLLMKKSEMDAYQVEQGTLANVKTVFKAMCKADKAVEAAVRKAVGSSKAKISALAAILK
jgi:hypothetical protein